MSSSKIEKLVDLLTPLYLEHSKNLLFHWRHHIVFVQKKALEFAEFIKADTLIVEAAALTHDLNYIIKPNSETEEGKEMRQNFLSESWFSIEEIAQIETVVTESHTGSRNKNITPEGMALSDADTLFKSLPITPIIFAQKYITQNKVDIYKLAQKVTSEQNPLMDQDIYFYTDYAKKRYLNWAKDNLKLWNNVIESSTDEDIKEMLKIAADIGVL